MVVLSTFLAIVALGVGIWAIAAAIERPDAAIIGAIIVMAIAGSAAVGAGVQVPVGTTQTTISQTATSDDVANSTFAYTTDVSGNETSPTGVVVRDSGTKLYFVGTASDAVFQYDLTDYELSTVTFNRSFATGLGSPTGMSFNFDGTRLYLTNDGDDMIYQYNLSEAWNISTAIQNNSYNVGADGAGQPRGVEFSNDGSRMYVIDGQDDLIYAYSLDENFNVSTATADPTFSVGGETSQATDLDFSEDGERILVTDSSDDTVYQYRLATAFDLSSASYSNENRDLSGALDTVSAVDFVNSGTKYFYAGRSNSVIVQYDADQSPLAGQTVSSTDFEELSIPGAVPIEIIVLLLGALMIFQGLGRASEQ